MLTRVHSENVHGGVVSSSARKLAKRIKLTERQKGDTKHGCQHCRDHEVRQELIRQIVALHGATRDQRRGLIMDPATVTCPECSALWRVAFGADKAGDALVSFAPVVLS